MAAASPAGANSSSDPTVLSPSTVTATAALATASSPAAALPDSPAVLSAVASPSSSVSASPASAPAANKPSSLPIVIMQRSEPPKSLRGLNKPSVSSVVTLLDLGVQKLLLKSSISLSYTWPINSQLQSGSSLALSHSSTMCIPHFVQGNH